MKCIIIGDLKDTNAISCISSFAFIEHQLDIPLGNEAFANAKSKLEGFFGAKPSVWWLIDLPKRFAKSFLQNSQEFDRFVIVFLPLHLPLELQQQLGVCSHEEVAKRIGSTIRESSTMQMFLSILVTSDLALLENPSRVFREFSGVLDYKSFGESNLVVKSILQSNIECFKEGANEFKRLVKWDQSKRILDFICLTVVFPVVVGIASGFGETVYKESKELATQGMTFFLTLAHSIQLAIVVCVFLSASYVIYKFFAIWK